MLRRQVTGWAIVAIAVVLVHRTTSQAAATRASWAGERSVLVLRSAVPSGSLIDASDVSTVRAPAALTPTDALRVVPDGARAAIDLRAGTPIGRSMLRSPPRAATARALQSGRMAVVVRTGELPTAASTGDLVDVASPGWDGPVATRARVVRVDGDTVTLAVREEEATPTATAALAGPVALVLRG